MNKQTNEQLDPNHTTEEVFQKENMIQLKSRTYRSYMALPYNPRLKSYARRNRMAGNLPEVLFWMQIKCKKFKGYDFDRQKIIGNYIVDFFCAQCGVVIEIDGESHSDKEEYDKERDTYLGSLGLVVIHITDESVLHKLDSVMEWLHYHDSFLSCEQSLLKKEKKP